jgi:hypothetical protein
MPPGLAQYRRLASEGRQSHRVYTTVLKVYRANSLTFGENKYHHHEILFLLFKRRDLIDLKYTAL